MGSSSGEMSVSHGAEDASHQCEADGTCHPLQEVRVVVGSLWCQDLNKTLKYGTNIVHSKEVLATLTSKKAMNRIVPIEMQVTIAETPPLAVG